MISIPKSQESRSHYKQLRKCATWVTHWTVKNPHILNLQSIQTAKNPQFINQKVKTRKTQIGKTKK